MTRIKLNTPNCFDADGRLDETLAERMARRLLKQHIWSSIICILCVGIVDFVLHNVWFFKYRLLLCLPSSSSVCRMNNYAVGSCINTHSYFIYVQMFVCDAVALKIETNLNMPHNLRSPIHKCWEIIAVNMYMRHGWIHYLFNFTSHYYSSVILMLIPLLWLSILQYTVCLLIVADVFHSYVLLSVPQWRWCCSYCNCLCFRSYLFLRLIAQFLHMLTLNFAHLRTTEQHFTTLNSQK